MIVGGEEMAALRVRLTFPQDKIKRPHIYEIGKAYDVLSKDKWFVENEAERLARFKEKAGRN